MVVGRQTTEKIEPDTEAFRLRRFIEELAQIDELDVYDERLELARLHFCWGRLRCRGHHDLGLGARGAL